MNYSYISNVLSLSSTVTLCFLTNPISSSRTCLSGFLFLLFSPPHFFPLTSSGPHLLSVFHSPSPHLSSLSIIPSPSSLYSQVSWRRTSRSWSSSPWCSSSPATLPVSTVCPTYCTSPPRSPSTNETILSYSQSPQPSLSALFF